MQLLGSFAIKSTFFNKPITKKLVIVSKWVYLFLKKSEIKQKKRGVFIIFIKKKATYSKFKK